MIITSLFKLTPGKIYNEKDLKMPFELDENKHETYTFLVIREATLEEYRDEIEEMYDAETVLRVMNYDYFYEISMD